MSGVAASVDNIPPQEDILKPSQLRDDDPEDSHNKTEFTDAEQSTLLANNDNVEEKDDEEGNVLLWKCYDQDGRFNRISFLAR